MSDQIDLGSPPPQSVTFGGSQITLGYQSMTTQQYTTMIVNPRAAVNPKRGSIISYIFVNETPFYGKGQSIILPNYMEKQHAVSMRYMHPPEISKFQRDFMPK